MRHFVVGPTGEKKQISVGATWETMWRQFENQNGWYEEVELERSTFVQDGTVLCQIEEKLDIHAHWLDGSQVDCPELTKESFERLLKLRSFR